MRGGGDSESPRSRQHGVLGALCPAAPRTGILGHRVLRRGDPHLAPSDGAGGGCLQRGHHQEPARRLGHRPQPLFHQRANRHQERPAVRGRIRQRTHRRVPQRQPDQRQPAPAGPGGVRFHLPVHLRHRGDHPPHRHVTGADPDEPGHRRAPSGQGFLLARVPHHRHHDRRPRPRGFPAADPGPVPPIRQRRILRGGVGNLRARPHRSRVRPRGGARRGAGVQP